MLEYVEDHLGAGILQKLDKVIIQSEEDEVLKLLDLYTENVVKKKDEDEEEIEEEDEEGSGEKSNENSADLMKDDDDQDDDEEYEIDLEEI